jgi:hypothetical protein
MAEKRARLADTSAPLDDIYVFKFVAADGASQRALYKVGRSAKVLDRRRDLARRFQGAFHVIIVHVFRGYGELERDVHKCLDEARVQLDGQARRRHREFFSFQDDACAVRQVKKAVDLALHIVKRTDTSVLPAEPRDHEAS